jgi:hypothetical protein
VMLKRVLMRRLAGVDRYGVVVLNCLSEVGVDVVWSRD